MNKYNIIKNSLIFFLAIIGYLIIITTFNYFELIGPKVLSFINFIFMIMLFLYSGYTLASKSEKKGYLSGIIMGSVNMALLFIISFIIRSNLSSSIILYSLILLLSSTMGGMFGINLKKDK